jgi:hypothetical protein
MTIDRPAGERNAAPPEPDNPRDVTLASFGYKQELKRTLRFFSLFAISFSIVSISTGIFLNYGFAINQFGGASIWTWRSPQPVKSSWRC